ncbi:MAG: SDR family NAD(P)-dependent oxidoreductase [Dysgonamonadaceae bacterium]|jgi:NAD(P)-dependent dehydrogenase (short-subunit alcohol dehydrogenase family)|nr:SDR family NAD(P)-dependent oxidoreductase [Dysgonamonadaceae bacterium]
MDGKTFIITGGNSGLGYQCARNIALQSGSNNVVIASRNVEKSEAAVKQLVSETQNTGIYSLPLDLSSLQSVRSFAATFVSQKLPPLYGVVCNAISCGEKPAEDGFDMTFATGHLGHFLLANLLLKNMQDGRIIFVSSDQHNPPAFIAKIRYTDALEFARPNKYSHNTKYSFTKLCNIYCVYELSAKLRSETDKNITVNAFNPGFMADTGLAKPKNTAEKLLKQLAPLLARLLGMHSSAAISGKLLAEYMTNAKYEGITGKYFDRTKEIPSSELSYSKANAANLWKRSVELTRLQQQETVFII